MRELLVEPAWVSTIDHVERASALLGGASWFAKLTGRYRIPVGMPSMSMVGMLSAARWPLVILASGALELRPGELAFGARPLRLPRMAAHGLDEDLSFAVSAGDVLLIERYRGASPFAAQFDVMFSRVRTRRPGLLGDFLLCVGGAGPRMERFRQQNQQLLVALRQALLS